MCTKKVSFTENEFTALAYALKSRISIIEAKALAYNGETPQTFKNCLENDLEYKALVSLVRKFEID